MEGTHISLWALHGDERHLCLSPFYTLHTGPRRAGGWAGVNINMTKHCACKHYEGGKTSCCGFKPLNKMGCEAKCAGAGLILIFNVLPVPFYAVDTSRASARVAGARGNISALA